MALILAICETRKLSKQLTLKHRSQMLLLNDTAETRSLIGQAIAINTYADGRVELRANKQVFDYTSLAVLQPTSLTDTDPRSLHATLDKKQRARLSRRFTSCHHHAEHHGSKESVHSKASVTFRKRTFQLC